MKHFLCVLAFVVRWFFYLVIVGFFLLLGGAMIGAILKHGFFVFLAGVVLVTIVCAAAMGAMVGLFWLADWAMNMSCRIDD